MPESPSVNKSTSEGDLPDPALPAPPLHDDHQGFTAEQLINKQAELEEQAREAIPFDFMKGLCTYDKGYIRQPVYACRTCGGGGVCAGCSVGCHADHDLVELFAKRSFRCDCGTLSLCRGKSDLEEKLSPCQLRSKQLSFAPQNDENKYNHNFDGIFCRCERGRSYNPETEEETMFQCLVCEDWIHESCSSIRPSKEISDVNDAKRLVSNAPLVDYSYFDLFICNECVRQPGNEVLRYYVGSKGWIACMPELAGQFLPDAVDDIVGVKVTASGEGWVREWRVYGLETSVINKSKEVGRLPAQEKKDEFVTASDDDGAEKNRKRVLEIDTQDGKEEKTNAKRMRSLGGLVVMDDFSESSQDDGIDAPVVPDSSAAEICIQGPIPLFAEESFASMPRLDVFLTQNFRDRVCRCSSCMKTQSHLPFILEPEETYSPPRSQASQISGDNGSDGGASQTSSTYDLGLAALNRLPRERMLESLQAYNRMRDALFEHLRPFADQGRVVDEESVREFFRQQRQQQKP